MNLVEDKVASRNVRGVSVEAWQRARIAAVRRRMSMGAAVTEALDLWVAECEEDARNE